MVGDVAVHAPHREGDQRNHHAHVLTSTRKLEAQGFTAKITVRSRPARGCSSIGSRAEYLAGLAAISHKIIAASTPRNAVQPMAGSGPRIVSAFPARATQIVLWVLRQLIPR
ncbi:MULTISPECIES: MobA/MobL family protein [Marinovum]|uniref:MobA/MobL family protein n=1 Tax=Marinovum TaxID=367771 RepID=UPI00237BF18F|nr:MULTISPECIES: MobA/MobL family protein [Marinovum]MDD9746157.1 MobA/MobL family protein [Marinovum sp. PR37]